MVKLMEPIVELPVVIESLPDQRGFTAHLAAPLDLSAVGATAEEAHRQLAALLQSRLRQGLELRTLTVPVSGTRTPTSGWLPDDELTRDWLKQVEQFRAECDTADRARLDPVPAQQETAS
jgi:hypothetical protein